MNRRKFLAGSAAALIGGGAAVAQHTYTPRPQALDAPISWEIRQEAEQVPMDLTTAGEWSPVVRTTGAVTVPGMLETGVGAPIYSRGQEIGVVTDVAWTIEGGGKRTTTVHFLLEFIPAAVLDYHRGDPANGRVSFPLDFR